MDNQENSTRKFCYKCYRPKSSCMCQYCDSIRTNTRFVILMHPKEFRKTKNGTGRFTHLQLKNSEVIIGIDFSSNDKVNSYINDPLNDCYILYPGKDSIELNSTHLDKNNQNIVIFILDSTWACSVKMLRVSSNLQNL